MVPELTTLLYIEENNQYLMMHRISKKNDINKDKWVGIGGHFEGIESPEECIIRETKEETGYSLKGLRYRAMITFVSMKGEGNLEYMSLFTADGHEGTQIDCNEGTLEWVDKDKVYDLNLWPGDYIFFDLLEKNAPFFSLKMVYDENDNLTEAVLDGEVLDVEKTLQDIRNRHQ